MTEKLVRTGREIALDCSPWLRLTEEEQLTKETADKQKYLILPAGLDALEETLNDMISITNKPLEAQVAKTNVSSVFARFKKEQGIQ